MLSIHQIFSVFCDSRSTLTTISKIRGLHIAGLYLLFWVPIIIAAESAVPIPDAARPQSPSGNQQRIPQSPSNDPLFSVPPLIDRPLGSEEGDRLVVRGFNLLGVVNRPQFGISTDALHQFVEQIRIKRQQLGGEKIEGFTPGAIKETAKILRDLIAQPQNKFDADQLESLIKKLRDENFNQGLTIGQLQEIANEVTQYYRQRGFILAQAYIPAQTVENGVVIIQVLEGTLSDVVVENNHRYTSQVLRSPFTELIGQPVIKNEIETGLLQLTDFPGLGVFGVFRPGTVDVGSTNLVLNVQEERVADFRIGLDNYGTEFTGEGRATMDVTFNNPTQSGDKAVLSIIQTFNPESSTYGSLSYEIPIIHPRNGLGVIFNHNAFEADVTENYAIQGDTNQAVVYFRRTFVRSRQANSFALIAFDRKEATVESVVDHISLGEDKLSVLNLEYGSDWVDAQSSGVNFYSIKLSHGFADLFGSMEADNAAGASRSGSGAEFDKVEIRYHRLQSLGKSQSLLFSLHLFYSEDLLTSTEQMSIGGPANLRALAPSQYLRDKAVFGSLEWTIKAPGYADIPLSNNKTMGDVFQVALFVDSAVGWLNKPSESDIEKISATGIGIGLRFDFDNLDAKIDVATPVSNDDADNGRDPQVYGEVKYRF